MTFLAFRPFRQRKHRNDVIVTSYIKISQILKLKSKDITSKTLHAKFYASRIKNKRIRGGGGKIPRVWSVFKSPGKIGLSDLLGICSPFFVRVKILLQEACRTKYGWDTPSHRVHEYRREEIVIRFGES